MLHFKDTILNFLDLETTGGNYNRDKIIEIYITKVKNGEVIDTYHTLLNPGFTPDPFILRLTNINPGELKSSPRFEDIGDEIYEFLDDGIFIAHNARFDYSFIKSEFRNLNVNVTWDYCCTVKLSRYLYPQYKSHGLDKIIERIGYEMGERHRASYDTEVTKHFFFIALKEHGEDMFLEAFNHSIRKSAIPNNLLNLNLETIPETPGVYLFYSDEDIPIYVGMSKNIRRRVLDHFYQDLTNSKDLNINQKLKRIETIKTAGVIGALIRESLLIKKYQPLYNRMLRRHRDLVKLEKFIDEKGYFNVRVNNDNDFSIDNIQNVIAVLRSRKDVKNYLSDIAKNFNLCQQFLGLEKKGKTCFAYQLGRCDGACCNKIRPEEFNKIFEEAFKDIKIQSWPFEGEIEITENNGEFSETFTFDKWCLVKSTIEDEIFNEIEKFRFDLDLYKILRRSISRINN